MILGFEIRIMCRSTDSEKQDLIINAENINFCPGPCHDTNPEPLPRKFGNDDLYAFKPHSGGRYASLSYPMSDGGHLVLQNVRLCRSCCRRHMEFEDNGFVDYLISDCRLILKKMEIMGIVVQV